MTDTADLSAPGAAPAGEAYLPIDTEYDLAELPVEGELPAGLSGTLYRNGPNPQFPPLDPMHHHWFVGDGMVHAFTLRGGRASYRNRWVRTDKWLAEHAAGRALVTGFGGPSAPGVHIANTGVANTNIVHHARRLLALEEAHLPFEMDMTSLATRGIQNFGGALHGPFTAHPKTDPVTGELVFFGYSADGPLSAGMTYGTIAADGRVTRFERFEAPYCSMVHDFAVTARHVLFPVLPLAGSMARARAGKMPFAWEPELGGHLGLLDRTEGVASLRWFRAASCYAFHVLNAWDEDGRIVADVMRHDEPPLFPRADGRPGDPAAQEARLVRWTLDPTAGTDAFRQEVLDEMTGEFPRLDERRAGLRNRYGIFSGRSRDARDLDTIVRLDFQEGRRSALTLPRGDVVSEAVFAPRGPGADEGDGWLLAVVWRAREQRSDLVVLDAGGIETGPVATVRLARRVPAGFHGNWVADAA